MAEQSILLRDLRHIGFRNLCTAQNELLPNGPILEVFFSLHANDVLLYVSEIVSASSNPHFGVVSIPHLGKRSPRVKIRVWQLKNAAWHCHMDLTLDIRKLVLLGRTIDPNPAVFGPNTVVWCFDGQHYCLRSDIKNYSSRTSSTAKKLKKSYSVDDIRLTTSLCTGIRELEIAKQKLSRQIDAISADLLENPVSYAPEKLRLLKFDLHSLHRYIAKQKRANDTLISQVYAKKLHMSRITLIVEDEFPNFREICAERLEIIDSQIDPVHESLNESIYPDLILMLKLVVAVVGDAFAIGTLETGHFTILGTQFPSSIKELLETCYYGNSALEVSDVEFENDTTSKINAGLSYIVLLVMTLAEIMGVLLKYHMTYAGSQSYLVDHLAPQQLEPVDRGMKNPLHKPVRVVYPLFFDMDHTEKAASYDTGRKFVLKNARFEQGLNLLNKNLVMLISGITDLYSQYYHDNLANHLLANNIPVDCLDNFLWNLQYVLLFVTAPKP